MGHIPERLVLELRDQFSIKCAIETGTYKAQSARFIAENFERVWSIEMDKSWWVRACEILKEFPSITLVHGDSRRELNDILAKLDGPVVFWLDAHWCGGARDDQKPEEECPLREELLAVRAFDGKSYILIDDARLFTGRPKYPHNPDLWPTLEEIKRLLPSGYYTAIADDVIISVPLAARDTAERFERGQLR